MNIRENIKKKLNENSETPTSVIPNNINEITMDNYREIGSKLNHEIEQYAETNTDDPNSFYSIQAGVYQSTLENLLFKIAAKNEQNI